MKYDYKITDEHYKLVLERGEAIRRQDWKRCEEITKIIPLHPATAMAAKNVYGVEYLKSTGFNLEWANKEFGDDWLTK